MYNSSLLFPDDELCMIMCVLIIINARNHVRQSRESSLQLYKKEETLRLLLDARC